VTIVKATTDIDPFEVEDDDHAAAAERMHEAAERAAFTSGLRELADWLDEHPDVQLPYLGRYIPDCALPSLPIYLSAPYSWDTKPDLRTQLANVARAMGHANKTPGRTDNSYMVWRAFGGIALYAQAARDEVCERVVIGTEPFTEEVPDPDALAAVPKIVKTGEREIVEWRCGPLLSGEDGAL